MAHGKSAQKRVRQNETHRLRNRRGLSALHTQMKKARAALSEGSLERARTQFAATVRALDKAASKGVIHKNEAGRRKSRLAKQLADLAAKPSA